MSFKKILIALIVFLPVFMNVKALDTYLTEVIIDEIPLESFTSETTEYHLNYPSDKESIKIGYKFNQEMYNVSTNGSTQLVLKPGQNIFTITVTNKGNPDDKRVYTLYINKEDGRSNDNTLSSLMIDDRKIDLFDGKYNYEVEIQNNLKSVEIKATLNSSSASFVQGYGERTGNNAVTLSDDPKTTVEIKVKAENEEIRTYTITLVKVNYKSNDATLKNLKIKDVDFNFNSSIYEYNLEVLNSVTKLEIEAIANHEKANVQYQKNIVLKNGINNFSIIVTAEDGTQREYKLNIVRKEEEPLVQDLQIEGIDLDFDPKVYEYDVETTLTTLNFTLSLSNKTAKYEILNNDDLEDGSIVKVIVTDGSKKVTYKFKIINPLEKGKGPSDMNSISTNTIGGVGFFKRNEMLIGLVVFGIGLLSLLIAILTRPKDSQIM